MLSLNFLFWRNFNFLKFIIILILSFSFLRKHHKLDFLLRFFQFFQFSFLFLYQHQLSLFLLFLSFNLEYLLYFVIFDHIEVRPCLELWMFHSQMFHTFHKQIFEFFSWIFFLGFFLFLLLLNFCFFIFLNNQQLTLFVLWASRYEFFTLSFFEERLNRKTKFEIWREIKPKCSNIFSVWWVAFFKEVSQFLVAYVVLYD